MDLQKDLLESSGSKRDKRGWRASVVSVVLHGALVGGIVYAGTHQVTQNIANEKPIDAFITQGAAPPPPPPPPPPKSSGAPKQSTPKPVEIPKPMISSSFTAPVEIPKEVPVVDVPTATVDPEPGALDTGSSDALAGVAGGVVGGIVGGVIGGEVGGVTGGEIGGVAGGVVGGEVGGTGTATQGSGTGGLEAPVVPEPPPPPPVPEGPLRVGGNVKAPVAIERAEPNYTDTARKARISGTVIVEAIIDKQGNVDHVKVVKGLPMGLSEEAAKAVRRWKFRPGTMNGEPVATIFNLTVTFKLD